METDMKLSKKVQRILMASAVVLAMGTGGALADGTNPTALGTCNGAAGANDCVTANGHVSVSVTNSLTINEMRAISFGNISKGAAPAATDTIVLGTDGSRTATGNFIPLTNGADASGGATVGDTGGQSPGHYTIEGGAEDTTATQVYISFADSAGNIIDMCSPGGPCDNYHPGEKVDLAPPAGGGASGDLYVDSFVINETGSDVYGHYVDNDGDLAAPSSQKPFLHDGSVGAAGAGVFDVVVGATLHSNGQPLNAGKYVGNFQIMASY
jgi:hypothetical protein